MRSSTFRNQFHRYTRTIRHRGDVPAYSTIARHIRASRPSDCISPWSLIRDDGADLIVMPDRDGPRIIAL